jgi:hypothetical protein
MGWSMNMSSGLNRVGKVVFWLITAVSFIAAFLLYMGMERTGMSENAVLKFFIIATLGLVGGEFFLLRGKGHKNTLFACVLAFYSLVIGYWNLNVSPEGGIWQTCVMYVVIACAIVAIFTMLLAVGRYVLQGFTSKV